MIKPEIPDGIRWIAANIKSTASLGGKQVQDLHIPQVRQALFEGNWLSQYTPVLRHLRHSGRNRRVAVLRIPIQLYAHRHRNSLKANIPNLDLIHCAAASSCRFKENSSGNTGKHMQTGHIDMMNAP